MGIVRPLVAASYFFCKNNKKQEAIDIPRASRI